MADRIVIPHATLVHYCQPNRPTSGAESLTLAKALKATLTDFGVRAVVMAAQSDVVRRTCQALAKLVMPT